MDQFRNEGVILDDNLRVDDEEIPGFIVIRGEIRMRGSLVMHVEKVLALSVKNGVSHVETVSYAYNVSLAGKGNIFRYDNSKVKEGHLTAHHKHVFDPPDNQVDLPEVGSDWPTLAEAIREADNYYLANLAQHDG